MLVIGVNVCGLKSLNERLNLAHLLGLIGVHTKDKLGGGGLRVTTIQILIDKCKG